VRSRANTIRDDFEVIRTIEGLATRRLRAAHAIFETSRHVREGAAQKAVKY
jgi:hypothetical protein